MNHKLYKFIIKGIAALSLFAFVLGISSVGIDGFSTSQVMAQTEEDEKMDDWIEEEPAIQEDSEKEETYIEDDEALPEEKEEAPCDPDYEDCET